ncbi:GCN5-related protein N-acetyltransferase [Beutenbergia cavernae DSM 12333]|uniref:GCN5-related protein N-acetyltransferase n=1 Tax=Beutenbergia cavernae (strain ATCC BAA-8 / DSM 12333 / CCUG 43141 / JCM 11478 / NBRC 16432 / NCIMB 13614 / HKI 0122) TaxID=471853 RepID=C5BVR2_BEUC1|nr:GNAT family N-acetyltransferase [Beutenbergia cavernae]ACQ78502.1 GCN5-related protein N-acetyltransferase [Beutenbergia cavernae DSM 12333]
MADPAVPQGIEVRLARDDELEQVVRLRWRWSSERGTPVVAESDHVAAAAAWAREHRDTHLPHIALDDGGVVVGMAWLALTPRVPGVGQLQRTSGDLQSCYVVPERRGAGIGGALTRAVLATALERGAEHVTVHASPSSVRMYARHGFAHSDRLLWAEAAIAEA